MPLNPTHDERFRDLGDQLASAAVAAVNQVSADAEQPQTDGPQTFGAGLFDPKALAKQLAVALVPLLIGAIADKVPGISTIELSNYVISKINELL